MSRRLPESHRRALSVFVGPAASLLAVLGLLTSLLTVSQTLMSTPASAASATILLASTGDTYLPGILASASNLSAPDFSSSSDTATDVTGNSPAGLGDTVQYNLTFINSGDDPSTNTVVSDPLPPDVTFVPGSLAIVAADGTATPLTDTAGDDQAEFDPATNTVTARLGCGADASTGGVIVSPSTTNSTCTTTQTSLVFRVRLGAAGSTSMADGPQLNYTAQSSGVNVSCVLTPPSKSDIGAGSNVGQNQGAPAVAISDIASSVVPSAAAGYRVSVQYGPDGVPDSTLTVDLPPGLDSPAVGLDTTSLQTRDMTANCSIAGLVLTCGIGSLDSDAEVVLDVQGVAAISLSDGAKLTAAAWINTDPAATGLTGDPATAQITVQTASANTPDSTSTSSTTTASTSTSPTTIASTTTAPTTSAPSTTAAATTAPATTVPATTAPDMGPPATTVTPPPAPPAAPAPAPWSAAIQAPLASALPALPDAAMADPDISVTPPPTVVIPSAAPTMEMPPSLAPANVASPATASARAPALPPSVAPPRAPDPPALPAIFERLAATGSNPFADAGVAVILLVAGLVLMVASGVRRRR